MIPITRILKDHRDAGTVSGLLALWGFVDDTTFLTKAGALGQVFRLRGVDFECLDHDERRAVTHRMEQGPSPSRRVLPCLSVLDEAPGQAHRIRAASESRRQRRAAAPRRLLRRQGRRPLRVGGLPRRSL